jgi:hypothetical protein
MVDQLWLYILDDSKHSTFQLGFVSVSCTLIHALS